MFRRQSTCAGFGAALLLGCSLSAIADTNDHYLDLTAGYSRGEFDTGQVSRLYRLQFTYGQVADRYDYSITAPYLFLSNNQYGESGIGDVILRAGIVLNNNHATNRLYGSVATKLPVADESKGLGTGEADAGGFLNYSYHFNEMNLLLMGGYIVTGDSPQQSYEDILVYGIGLSRRINKWYVYGSLDGRQQVLGSGDDPLELSGGLLYQIKAAQFIKAEGVVGLNDGSLDYGLAVGVVNWF